MLSFKLSIFRSRSCPLLVCLIQLVESPLDHDVPESWPQAGPLRTFLLHVHVHHFRPNYSIAKKVTTYSAQLPTNFCYAQFHALLNALLRYRATTAWCKPFLLFASMMLTKLFKASVVPFSLSISKLSSALVPPYNSGFPHSWEDSLLLALLVYSQ